MTELELKIRKLDISFALFCGGYWLWCIANIVISIFRIVGGDGFNAILCGVIHIVCLFMCAIWIDELGGGYDPRRN